MEFIKTKTILTKARYGDQWYDIDYNMNLYKGCPHGCIYCDSRSLCYHIENFDIVRGKEDALIILEKELMRKRQKGVVGIGAMSDTYHPLERKYKQTRNALKLLERYGFGVSIDTKSDLILRDIDLLKKINLKSLVIIKFTITIPYDDLSKIIEPHVCVSSQRFNAIKNLSQQGLFVGVMMNPVLPFVTDQEDDMKTLVHLTATHGAKFIHTYMSMTLRNIQREHYYKCLDQNFPGIKEKYIQNYGNQYQCYPKHAQKLYQIFCNECEKYGLLYQMSDIIKAYKKEKRFEQISLF
ncbi:radical SAM protein [Allocoprobacillus halotolerans]|uniref:Radical SAM protein n=1 Tax=Allocoprobacillus halotolerans TaxID=2944914 RepID=A0ABY5I4H0_9FIRM|nr:radical SAM protein [Allocoprobacillus halotolerans]UTY39284.1 radical SAM protein [Allocoprobacillus halotolerans]